MGCKRAARDRRIRPCLDQAAAAQSQGLAAAQGQVHTRHFQRLDAEAGLRRDRPGQKHVPTGHRPEGCTCRHRGGVAVCRGQRAHMPGCIVRRKIHPSKIKTRVQELPGGGRRTEHDPVDGGCGSSTPHGKVAGGAGRPGGDSGKCEGGGLGFGALGEHAAVTGIEAERAQRGADAASGTGVVEPERARAAETEGPTRGQTAGVGVDLKHTAIDGGRPRVGVGCGQGKRARAVLGEAAVAQTAGAGGTVAKGGGERDILGAGVDGPTASNGEPVGKIRGDPVVTQDAAIEDEASRRRGGHAKCSRV